MQVIHLALRCYGHGSGVLMLPLFRRRSAITFGLSAFRLDALLLCVLCLLPRSHAHAYGVVSGGGMEWAYQVICIGAIQNAAPGQPTNLTGLPLTTIQGMAATHVCFNFTTTTNPPVQYVGQYLAPGVGFPMQGGTTCISMPATTGGVPYGGAIVVRQASNGVGTFCTGSITPTGSQVQGACPSNSAWVAGTCTCNADYAANPPSTACVPRMHRDWTSKPDRCERPKVGDPILPLDGVERMSLDLGSSLAGYRLNWTYNTARRAPTVAPDPEPMVPEKTVFGELGFGSLHRRVIYDIGSKGARVTRGDGDSVTFTPGPTGSFVADVDVPDRLSRDGQGFRFVDARAQAIESYDAGGRLTGIKRADGRTLTLSYSTEAGAGAPATGYLLSVQDGFGRSVSFEYELRAGGDPATDGRVKTVILPQGQVALGYTGANLTSITWPDAHSRQFRYERSGLPWALTGVVDENNVAHATIGYDNDGRAISSVLAGGVDGYSVSYTQPPAVEVTDTYDADNNIVISTRSWRPPTGTSITLPNASVSLLSATGRHGLSKPTSRSQPAGSGCDESTSLQDYDASGNVAWRNDFNGRRVCYAHDQIRNVESVRVEGLGEAQQCDAVTGMNLTLPSGSRKVSTEWHPLWRLKSRVAEPRRRTSYVYNGQTDPTTFETVTCAHPGATLPLLLDNTTPLALLCRQVEEATTDADGSQGFNADLQPLVAKRVRNWTYDENGQVRTETDPRNSTTSYEYYPTTTFTGTDPNAEAQTKGDLKQVTNAMGKVMQYTLYNRAGQLTESKDPNNVVTRYGYDARQRLRSVSVGGQTTEYTYWPTGLLKRVTQPDGVSFVNYTYDAAHRLYLVEDNRGNSIAYTLDNLGNRTEEKVNGVGNVLRRQLNRDIDALGRVQKITGRE